MTQAAALYCDKHAANLLPCLTDIGSTEIDLFHHQGFIAVERAFAPEAVADALSAIDALIDGAAPDFRGLAFEPGTGRSDDLPAHERRLRVRKLMKFVDHDARLQALSTDAGLLDVVQRLMFGEAPELFQDMALLKPPGGSEKPWHQDMAYFNVPVDTTVVGVWIALDEATVENGAMHILPGSHILGPRYHFKRRDWQICDTEVPTGQDVVVPLPPGGALLWHGLTHHGSPENHSGHRRRALQFHYRPDSVLQTTTDERMQHYGGEVRDAQC